MKSNIMKKLDAAGIQLKKPKPGALILTGVFMLSLYGSLTGLPGFSGIIAFVSLLSSAAVGLYYFLRSI